MSKGIHVILDCYDVPRDVCLDDKRLLETVIRAARNGGATIINTSRYRFGHNSPPGCTIFVMMDESHISVHTYAEEKKMAVDVFTCGDTDSQKVVKYLLKELRLTNLNKTKIERF